MECIAYKTGYIYQLVNKYSTIITLNIMRGLVVHDACIPIDATEKMSKEKYRKPVDELLWQMCKEDGMTSIRAWLVYQGVRLGGSSAADPDNVKEVVKAPRVYQ